MTPPPVVLAISGFDGSGGAGTLADARAIQLNGGYPCTVVTAITAQNTIRVDRVQPVAPEFVRSQLDCIADDFEIAAIKVGLLPNPACVETLIECFDARRLNCPIVLDPVIHSSSGSRLSDEEAVGALVQLLLPRATLITPNIDEASNLSNVHIRDLEHVIHAGRQLVHMGCQQVLVKGGHLDDRKGTDVLCYREGHEIFEPDERREGDRSWYRLHVVFVDSVLSRSGLFDARVDSLF